MIVINLVLVPAIKSAEGGDRVALIELIFPRLFKLATLLGGLAVLTGTFLVSRYTQLHFGLLFSSRWGWLVLIGGLMGLVLCLFHLFQEENVEHTLMSSLVEATKSRNQAATDALLRKLGILPRAGMVALLIAILLMVAATHLGLMNNSQEVSMTRVSYFCARGHKQRALAARWEERFSLSTSITNIVPIFSHRPNSAPYPICLNRDSET